LDELSRTVTAGDLALAVGRIELETISLPLKAEELLLGNAVMDDLTSRVDLIAFDSPFITDPPDPDTDSSSIGPDFEDTWNALEGSNARGWCEISTDVVVRRLQGLPYRLTVIAIDRPPFEGDLKVLIAQGSAPPSAALRLRESEDESCLWRLRCEETASELRTKIKRLLTEGC
jgi:AP-4 complex subunit epsilon-1